MNPGLFAQPPPAHLVCRVCRGVYHQPRVNQCGHTLCSGCYSRAPSDTAAQQRNGCLQCGRALAQESSVPNSNISEEVQELRVHCIYHFQLTPSLQSQRQFMPAGLELVADPNGCDAVISLDEIDSHMAACDFRPAPCPYDTVNCQGSRQRDAQRHAKECIFRLLELPPREILGLLSERQSKTLSILAGLDDQLRSVESRVTERLNRIDATFGPASVESSAAASLAAPASAASSTPLLTAASSVVNAATSARSSAVAAAANQSVRLRNGQRDVFDFGVGDVGIAGKGIGAGGLGRSPSLPAASARVNGLSHTVQSIAPSYLTCIANINWHSNTVVSLLLIADQLQLVSLDSTGAIVAWNIQQLCSGHVGNARAVERLSDALYADSFVCACKKPGPDDDKYVFVGCRNGSLVQLARFARGINRVKTVPAAHAECITAIAASPNGLLFSGSRGELKVWKCSNLQHLQTFSVPSGQSVRVLTFDAWRGALLCACQAELHRFIVLADLRASFQPQGNQQPPLQLDEPGGYQRYGHELLTDITCITVTEDRILLGTGVPAQSLWLFCANTGRFQVCLAGGTALSCLSSISDGAFAIAGCQNGALQVWRLLNSRQNSVSSADAAIRAGHSTGVVLSAVLRQQTERHCDSVSSISIMQDLLFTGSGDGWMKVFRFRAA